MINRFIDLCEFVRLISFTGVTQVDSSLVDL